LGDAARIATVHDEAILAGRSVDANLFSCKSAFVGGYKKFDEAVPSGS
jgi:hypothetical protein